MLYAPHCLRSTAFRVSWGRCAWLKTDAVATSLHVLVFSWLFDDLPSLAVGFFHRRMSFGIPTFMWTCITVWGPIATWEILTGVSVTSHRLRGVMYRFKVWMFYCAVSAAEFVSCRMSYDWSILLILILTSFLPTGCRWRRLSLYMITLRHTYMHKFGLLCAWDRLILDPTTCITHNLHERQTFMFPAWFEPAIPAREGTQTRALYRIATGIDLGVFILFL
jgi:hypothetical protein